MSRPEPDTLHAEPREAAPNAAITMIQAISEARKTVAFLTELPVDGIVSSAPLEGGWRIVVDAVEAPARLGDNDLMASYEVLISGAGEVTGFTRLGRYSRTDSATWS